MVPHLHDPPRLSPWRHLAGAAAGGTTALTLVTAVLAAFSSISSDPWLAPTQEVLDAASGCDALHERRARERCMRTLVAARSQPAGPAVMAMASQAMPVPSQSRHASRAAVGPPRALAEAVTASDR